MVFSSIKTAKFRNPKTETPKERGEGVPRRTYH